MVCLQVMSIVRAVTGATARMSLRSHVSPNHGVCCISLSHVSKHSDNGMSVSHVSFYVFKALGSTSESQSCLNMVCLRVMSLSSLYNEGYGLNKPSESRSCLKVNGKTLEYYP